MPHLAQHVRAPSCALPMHMVRLSFALARCIDFPIVAIIASLSSPRLCCVREGVQARAKWASGDNDPTAIVWLLSSCRCCHRVAIASARACGQGWVRARTGATWVSGHDDGGTIATARSSRHRRHHVVARGCAGEGRERAECTPMSEWSRRRHDDRNGTIVASSSSPRYSEREGVREREGQGQGPGRDARS